MLFTYYLSNQPVFGPCVARVLILEHVWQRCLKIVRFSECKATVFVSMNRGDEFSWNVCEPTSIVLDCLDRWSEGTSRQD